MLSFVEGVSSTVDRALSAIDSVSPAVDRARARGDGVLMRGDGALPVVDMASAGFNRPTAARQAVPLTGPPVSVFHFGKGTHRRLTRRRVSGTSNAAKRMTATNESACAMGKLCLPVPSVEGRHGQRSRCTRHTRR